MADHWDEMKAARKGELSDGWSAAKLGPRLVAHWAAKRVGRLVARWDEMSGAVKAVPSGRSLADRLESMSETGMAVRLVVPSVDRMVEPSAATLVAGLAVQ